MAGDARATQTPARRRTGSETLRGKRMTDAERRIVAGDAWREFCDRLKAAGDPIFAADAASDPLSRAEGTRYLTRLVRAALETFVEFADPMAPVLRRAVHETVKM